MAGMTSPFRTLAAAAALSLAATAALGQSTNPACQRLEAQLTALDRGNSDPTRAERIKRAEEAVNRQQFEVDRLVAQARRTGCENSGFFSIFNNPPPQCGSLNSQIGQQRNTLERLQVDLERLQGGTADRMAQRQSLLISLGENNCGPQYRSAALQGQQGGFFDRLFGGNSSGGFSSAPSGPMGGTYRTICVRSCDGYYFPISFATSPERFRDDEQTCQRMCPASEVTLYTYHNPGEEVAQAVSLSGQPYSQLPTAFQYRQAYNKACSCRRPGESWADALKSTGPDATVAPGDVVVTEQSAKKLSQPPRTAAGKPPARGAAQQPETNAQSQPASADPSANADGTRRDMRSIGPSFLPPAR
jgi:hypothetical protein